MTAPVGPARDALDTLFTRFLEHLVEVSPVAATRLGDHRRDHDLDDWSPGEADRRLRVVAGLRAELEAVPGWTADAEVHGDAVLLGDALAAGAFELEGRRDHETDPLFWMGLATSAVHDLIRREDLEPGPRAQAVARRAAQVPRLLEQAAATLTEVPRPHRDLALLRLPGAVALFDDVLRDFAPAAAEQSSAAVAAWHRFGAWLEALEGPRPPWRLGAQRWGDALRLALGVRMAPDEIEQRALDHFAATQEEMQRLAVSVLGRDAAGLEGAALVRAGIAAAAADHVGRDELVHQASAVLDDITDFIREQGDFSLPDPDTLRVEEVPSFLQGSVVAFFVPAPPLEPAAAHTYYLSPVPAAWDDDRAASFLREYNIHALRSVGMHEAYPGHYVQLAAANRHPRLLRRVLWNSAFAEGWAVYVERCLIDAGYGGDGPAGDRLRLISAKMDLRSSANALLDQGMHIRGWSDEQAIQLLVDRAHQEPAEAQAKVLRAKTTAGQLSTYFVGGEEMFDLRRDVSAARGPAFGAASFHEDVLALGTPPFPVLRRALLGEAAA